MKKLFTITMLMIFLGLFIAIFGINSIAFSILAIVIFTMGAALEILALNAY